MTTKPSSFAGVLNRLAGENDKSRKAAPAGSRIGAAAMNPTVERSSPSIASVVGKSILAAYRELIGPEVRKVESSDGQGMKTIDFAKLERLIGRISSKQEMLRLRRQIALQYHPDTHVAKSHHEATATMARVNAMFDEALRTRFPGNAT